MIEDRNWKDAIAYVLLAAVAIVLLGFIYRNGILYGSKVDWISQHSVIPEYFRQNFYQTGNFFPDFAMNLGGGQNIYNLSYYGLYDPYILLSYLLPFLSMETYLIAVGVFVVISSSCLCYYWLRSNLLPRHVALIASICFLCAAPLIFHSHRQISFIDYFPFLFMALIGVDRYALTRKRWMFILGVFLCIMTSFFFSVGCIVSLFLYSTYKYLSATKKASFAGLIGWIRPFITGTIIAVFMSAILWLPTLYVILVGRGTTESPVTLLSLLIPIQPFGGLLYDSYSLGLSIVSFMAIIYCILSRKIADRVLASALLLLLMSPLILFLLNGGLYVRVKALIPFMPLYILITAIFILWFETYIKSMKRLAPYGQRGLMGLIIVLVITGSVSNCIIENSEEQLVTAQEYNDINNPDKIALIKKAINEDPTFFRMNDLSYKTLTCNKVYDPGYYQTSFYSSTCNEDYLRFYYDVLHNSIGTRNRAACVSSENILFQNYMNVKYVVSRHAVAAGYQLISEKGEYKLYSNENTSPFAYATSSVMGEDVFNKMGFPYNIGPLFENVIVNPKNIIEGTNDSTSGFPIEKLDVENLFLHATKQKNLKITNMAGKLHIAAGKEAYLKIPMPQTLEGNVFILRFKVSNNENMEELDTSITINGIKNKLSMTSAIYPNENHNFTYVLSANQKKDSLRVRLSEGKYTVYDFEAYIFPVASIEAANKIKDPFIVDSKNTGDNKISGDIQVTKDGFFASTIPFDKGFKIAVDGKAQPYEKVNTAFVGFPIKEGYHHIEMVYHAPLKLMGMTVSLFGCILFIAISIFDYKRKSIMKLEGNKGSANDI